MVVRVVLTLAKFRDNTNLQYQPILLGYNAHMDQNDARDQLENRPDPYPAMRKEDLLYEQRDRIVLGLAAKGWNTLARDMLPLRPFEKGV